MEDGVLTNHSKTVVVISGAKLQDALTRLRIMASLRSLIGVIVHEGAELAEVRLYSVGVMPIRNAPKRIDQDLRLENYVVDDTRDHINLFLSSIDPADVGELVFVGDATKHAWKIRAVAKRGIKVTVYGLSDQRCLIVDLNTCFIDLSSIKCEIEEKAETALWYGKTKEAETAEITRLGNLSASLGSWIPVQPLPQGSNLCY